MFAGKEGAPLQITFSPELAAYIRDKHKEAIIV